MKRKNATLALTLRLAELGSDQLGVVSLKQSRKGGVERHAVRTRALGGHFQRVHPGVFRATWSRPTFAQACLAAFLAVDHGVICGRSAAVLHGLPVGKPPKLPELVVPHGRKYRGRDITVRQTRHLLPSQAWKTARITTVGATLISMAGDVDRRTLERCIDHAIAHRQIEVHAVLAQVIARPAQRFRGRRILIVELLKRFDGTVRHRSRNEQRSHGWLVSLGLPEPKTNYVVSTPLGDVEVDCAWPNSLVALDISPFFTHGSEEKQRRDAFRRRALAAADWQFIEALDEHIVSIAAFAVIARTIALLLARRR